MKKTGKKLTSQLFYIVKMSKKRKKGKQKRIFLYKKNFFYAITIICVLPNNIKIQIIDCIKLEY